MHKRFKLWRAGDGALNAFIHRIHFATDGLANGCNFSCTAGFWISKLNSDMCHSASGNFKLAGTCDHDSKGKENKCRDDRNKNGTDEERVVNEVVGICNGSNIFV